MVLMNFIFFAVIIISIEIYIPNARLYEIFSRDFNRSTHDKRKFIDSKAYTHVVCKKMYMRNCAAAQSRSFNLHIAILSDY